jgi:hypothetical protein
LAELSVQALRHAQILDRAPVESVAARLYAWNRLPSSAWRQVRAEPSLIAKAASASAGSDWEQLAPGPPATPWCVWRQRDAPAMPTGRCWKLYVSPRPRHLAEAVCAALTACAGLSVVSLKYGLDAEGMLRPDKLVVHLANARAVRELGQRLLRSLGGAPVQGVPFTCEIGGDGLLSWGIDPPRDPAAQTALSWRSWVTLVLANALCDDAGTDVEPWERALREVKRVGVNPQTWEPASDLWANESVTAETEA